MFKRFRAWKAAAGTVTLALLVTACAGGGNGDSSDPADIPEVDADGGDTFIVGMAAEPPHLIRLFLGDVYTGLVGLAMQESLVTVTRDSEIEPQLAESWELLDETHYRFHLREGVTWHDGEPFTADDVVFTLEEGLGVNAGTAALGEMLESATAVDDHTVDVNLKYPSGAFLAMLNPMSFSILPEHVYAGTDLEDNPANRAPVGTGPFQFESWESNRITLTRNDDYWGDTPGYSSVVFTVIGDPNARSLALKSGDIHYVNSYDVPYEAYIQLVDDPNVFLDTGRASYSLKMFPFNTRNPILATPEVRKALFQAIDRNFLSEDIFGGLFPPGTSPLPEDHWANSGSVNYMEELPFDPEAAEAALDAAGYPRDGDGVRFSLTHRYMATEPGGERVAEVMADYWRRIGVETTLLADDVEVFRTEVFANHNFDTYTINIASGADPAIGLYRRYTCDNDQNAVFGNASGYCVAEVDELFEQANAANEQEDRTPIYSEVQRMVADDLPTAILLEIPYTEAILDDLSGVEEFFRLGEVVLLDWSKIGPAEG